MGRMVKLAAEILVTVPPKAERLSELERSAIREWAIRYRFTDAERGRLSTEVIAMYRALHPGGAS